MIASQFETASVSLTGDRPLNQDRYGIFRNGDQRLLLVADGMGGHPRGEVAAALVIEYAAECFAAGPVEEPETFFRKLVTGAHRRIQEYGRSQVPPIQPGTTLVAVLVRAEDLSWVHAGDSRLYRLHSGDLACTRDHSYVQQLVDEGKLAPSDAERHPLRNYVTRCLGGLGPAPEPSFGSAAGLAAGDALLLCSDGFWGNLAPAEIEHLLRDRETPLQAALERLGAQAEAAGRPYCDNITALVLRC